MQPKFILFFVLFSIIASCSRQNLQQSGPGKIEFSPLVYDTEITDTDGSFRAISVLNNEFLVGGSPNLLVQNIVSEDILPNRACVVKIEDSISYDFRSVALTKNAVFALSAGSPAKLYKGSSVKNLELVYEELDEAVFYDSMQFWNATEGIAFGDEMNGCMSVIITRDGGNNWNKVPCDHFPAARDGDGAFAASNTNIAIIGNHTWLAAGKAIYYSPDKGMNWEKYEVPIIQQQETEGIYSIDFYNKKTGVAIGGNFQDPDANINNLIITMDGGKSWEVISDKQSPGYRSCIQFIPGTHGNGLMAVGFAGINISYDRGETWQRISDEAFLSFRFLDNNSGIITGREKIRLFELGYE